MKTIRFYFFIASFLFILSGCRALKAPVIVGNVPAQTFQDVYIQPTTELTSGASNLYTGAMMTKSVNPSDVIAGDPILIPEATDGFNVSLGIVFLFVVFWCGCRCETLGAVFSGNINQFHFCLCDMRNVYNFICY